MMRKNALRVTRWLLLWALLVPFFALAGDNSINDAFDALANSKGGSSSKSVGMDAFDDMANGKGGSDVGTGHGIDAGLQAIETNKAEKAAQAERQKRLRMEQEAQQQDKEMQGSCHCIYNNCPTIQIIRSCGGDRACEKETEARAARYAAHAEEIAAQAHRDFEEKKRVCDAWKAAGPKANSESFKAQLRQQDEAIASRQRVANEEAKRLDEMVRADFKKASEKAAKDQQDRDQAARDAERAETAAAAAKVKAEADEREAKQKAWCMADQSRLSYCSCARYRSTSGPACRM